jgi:hypothetical protein
MTPTGQSGRRRVRTLGLLALPLAIAGWIAAGAAIGAASQPSMEVLPKPTGLKYSQTVEIKGHHLPKGSGSVAATICGLQYPSGSTIANPGADDCAGAPEIGKLVIVKSWQSNGEFDTNYTLPASGQKFGKNARYCDHAHKCALVVADANPDNPAYHVETRILFTDQASTTSTTKPKTTTTTKSTGAPKPTTTTTQPNGAGTPPTSGGNQPTTTVDTSASGSSRGSVKAGASVTIDLPSGGSTPSMPPLTAPKLPSIPAPVAQALDQVCTQIGNAVTQAGGDPSALLAVCGALANGTGPAQLQLVLQSPSLLCVEGASLWQNNQQITAACNQAANALAPVTSQLAGVLAPILGNL